LLRLAKKPEIVVASSAELEAERNRFTAAKEKSIAMKNYLRAKDLVETLEEVEALRETYPSVEDLQKKEAEYKKKFSELLKAKRYDDANLVKRKILTIKRAMMKEGYAKPASTHSAARNSALLLEERMRKMKALTKKPENNVSGGLQHGSLYVSPTCTLSISSSSLLDCTGDGLICWTNEACDLSTTLTGKALLEKGGTKLKQHLESLDPLMETEWGQVKCATGEAVSLGPRTFGDLAAKFVFLAVPPVSPTNDDSEWDFQVHSGMTDAQIDSLHYLETGLKAVVRSSFRNIKNTGVKTVGLSTITTRPGDSEAYKRSLKVVLETIVEEAKRTCLTEIHLYACSGEEANQLIKTAVNLGLPLAK
jgi:hypothetical protein